MNEIEKLKARLVELSNTNLGIVAKADAEGRDLTADEAKEVDQITAEIDAVAADVKRRERVQAQADLVTAPAPRRTDPAPIENRQEPARQRQPDGLQNTVLTTHEQRARWGFQNMGEFARSVRAATVNPAGMDQRLVQNALSTYGSEGSGVDGGFAVPPEWRAAIMKMVDAEDSLLARTDQQAVGGNNITFPVDETTAWQSSGGIQAYWDSEAATITQSKPSLKSLDIKLTRLTALVPVTEELLEDASALSGYVVGKAGEKIAYKVNDAIINGTGVGQPMGIMTAPARVSVAKETSQTAATFHADNAVKMMSRMPAQSFARSVWLINQDVVPQIMKLGFAITTASGTAAGAGALYLPPNGLANTSPYGTLLGRPIVVSEACQTLGTVGDVILADLSKYLTVVKTGGIKTDVSMHLFFDQNATAFRFVLRMNGQPWLSTAITRAKGSNTLSHFVTVDTRA